MGISDDVIGDVIGASKRLKLLTLVNLNRPLDYTLMHLIFIIYQCLVIKWGLVFIVNKYNKLF